MTGRQTAASQLAIVASGAPGHVQDGSGHIQG